MFEQFKLYPMLLLFTYYKKFTIQNSLNIIESNYKNTNDKEKKRK